jgi:hypothetical protein
MTTYSGNGRPVNGTPPDRRKHNHDTANIDDVTDADRAVSIIAARFRLELHIARLVAELSGIGGCDRASAGGGRAK